MWNSLQGGRETLYLFWKNRQLCREVCLCAVKEDCMCCLCSYCCCLSSKEVIEDLMCVYDHYIKSLFAH